MPGQISVPGHPRARGPRRMEGSTKQLLRSSGRRLRSPRLLPTQTPTRAGPRRETHDPTRPLPVSSRRPRPRFCLGWCQISYHTRTVSPDSLLLCAQKNTDLPQALSRRNHPSRPIVASPWRFESCLLLRIRLWTCFLASTLGRQLARILSLPAWAGLARRRQDSHALVQKTCSLGLWPLRWKGGNVISLLKPHQPPQLCKSSRAILVSDWVGTLLAKFPRSKIEPVYESFVHDGRSRGRKGRGLTDFAAHTTIQFFSRAKRRGLCSILLCGQLRRIPPCLGPLPRGCRRPLAVSSGPRVHLAKSRRAGRHDQAPWGESCRCVGLTGGPCGYHPRCSRHDCWQPLRDLIFGLMFTYVVQEVRAQLLSEGICLFHA